ncbi:MAG: hypothetical protein RL559_273 [Pseudomonadota bacterium]
MSVPEENAGGLFGPPAHIPGATRYRGEVAQAALRLNRFLVHVSQRENRQRFLDDEEAEMARWALSEPERDLLRRRDYAGLLACGVNIYAIAKSGYVFGATLVDIGALLRGETVEQFLATKGRV